MGKRVTLQTKSTLVSIYMRMELTPLPEPIADNSACTCSDCLALTKLTCLGEPKCSHGKCLAWLGG